MDLSNHPPESLEKIGLAKLPRAVLYKKDAQGKGIYRYYQTCGCYTLETPDGASPVRCNFHDGTEPCFWHKNAQFHALLDTIQDAGRKLQKAHADMTAAHARLRKFEKRDKSPERK